MINLERILLSLAAVSLLIDGYTTANFGGILVTIGLCTLSFCYSAFGVLLFKSGRVPFVNLIRLRLQPKKNQSFILDLLIRFSFGTVPIALLAVNQNYSWKPQAIDLIILGSSILIFYIFPSKNTDAHLRKLLLTRAFIALVIGLTLKFS